MASRKNRIERSDARNIGAGPYLEKGARRYSAVGAAGVLLMLGASIIAPHAGSVLEGYKLEALKQERQTLINERRDLEVKEAGLLSPERLNALAQARKLTSPAADQVIHLDIPTASDKSFASNRMPALNQSAR